MKKWILIMCLTISSLYGERIYAQEYELQQLLLNIEKLTQLKSMLEDLKKGYEIVFQGYTKIKEISEEGFNLHDAFLSGLLQVSPVVRDYYKVSEIIQNSLGLVKEYRAALNAFRSSELLTVEELDHIRKVCDRLFQKSLSQLESLATVLSSGALRMSDNERLSSIDAIDEALKDQRTFLRHFTNSNKLLLLGRAKDLNDVEVSKN